MENFKIGEVIPNEKPACRNFLKLHSLNTFCLLTYSSLVRRNTPDKLIQKQINKLSTIKGILHDGCLPRPGIDAVTSERFPGIRTATDSPDSRLNQNVSIYW